MLSAPQNPCQLNWRLLRTRRRSMRSSVTTTRVYMLHSMGVGIAIRPLGTRLWRCRLGKGWMGRLRPRVRLRRVISRGIVVCCIVRMRGIARRRSVFGRLVLPGIGLIGCMLRAIVGPRERFCCWGEGESWRLGKRVVWARLYTLGLRDVRRLQLDLSGICFRGTNSHSFIPIHAGSIPSCLTPSDPKPS